MQILDAIPGKETVWSPKSFPLSIVNTIFNLLRSGESEYSWTSWVRIPPVHCVLQHPLSKENEKSTYIDSMLDPLSFTDNFLPLLPLDLAVDIYPKKHQVQDQFSYEWSYCLLYFHPMVFVRYAELHSSIQRSWKATEWSRSEMEESKSIKGWRFEITKRYWTPLPRITRVRFFIDIAAKACWTISPPLCALHTPLNSATVLNATSLNSKSAPLGVFANTLFLVWTFLFSGSEIRVQHSIKEVRNGGCVISVLACTSSAEEGVADSIERGNTLGRGFRAWLLEGQVSDSSS